MFGMEQELQKQRGEIDELMNRLKELDLESLKETIKQEVEQESIERDHPPGSPYFSFLLEDDPNNRYPGTTWVKIEENTYLVSAGPNLVGMTPVGSNTKNLTISNMPNHAHTGSISSVSLTTNSTSHSHDGYARVRNLASGSYPIREIVTVTNNEETKSTSSESHAHGINAHNHVLTINNNGSGEAFDNRPKSLAIYMWRRIS